MRTARASPNPTHLLPESGLYADGRAQTLAAPGERGGGGPPPLPYSPCHAPAGRRTGRPISSSWKAVAGLGRSKKRVWQVARQTGALQCSGAPTSRMLCRQIRMRLPPFSRGGRFSRRRMRCTQLPEERHVAIAREVGRGVLGGGGGGGAPAESLVWLWRTGLRSRSAAAALPAQTAAIPGSAVSRVRLRGPRASAACRGGMQDPAVLDPQTRRGQASRKFTITLVCPDVASFDNWLRTSVNWTGTERAVGTQPRQHPCRRADLVHGEWWAGVCWGVAWTGPATALLTIPPERSGITRWPWMSVS